MFAATGWGDVTGPESIRLLENLSRFSNKENPLLSMNAGNSISGWVSKCKHI